MSHFIFHAITLSNGILWEIAEAQVDFNSELYARAILQAKQKSQFTMDASQAGKYRSPELKFQMQLMGILAEIYSQEYLLEIIAIANLSEQFKVIRYDDVRTDGFKSAANEYDIKIESTTRVKEFKVESRSSITHNRSLHKAIEQFDIIGPYSSDVKSQEVFVDFFIRPLYEFIPFVAQKYLPGSFEKHLKAGEIKLQIVAGCTKNEMVMQGQNKSMRQNGTLYRVVKITKGYDVKKLAAVLTEKIN